MCVWNRAIWFSGKETGNKGTGNRERRTGNKGTKKQGARERATPLSNDRSMGARQGARSAALEDDSEHGWVRAIPP